MFEKCPYCGVEDLGFRTINYKGILNGAIIYWNRCFTCDGVWWEWGKKVKDLKLTENEKRALEKK